MHTVGLLSVCQSPSWVCLWGAPVPHGFLPSRHVFRWGCETFFDLHALAKRFLQFRHCLPFAGQVSLALCWSPHPPQSALAKVGSLGLTLLLAECLLSGLLLMVCTALLPWSLFPSISFICAWANPYECAMYIAFFSVLAYAWRVGGENDGPWPCCCFLGSSSPSRVAPTWLWNVQKFLYPLASFHDIVCVHTVS